MPRVVPDQESKFQSDELFRRLSRESEVRRYFVVICLFRVAYDLLHNVTIHTLLYLHFLPFTLRFFIWSNKIFQNLNLSWQNTQYRL